GRGADGVRVAVLRVRERERRAGDRVAEVVRVVAGLERGEERGRVRVDGGRAGDSDAGGGDRGGRDSGAGEQIHLFPPKQETGRGRRRSPAPVTSRRDPAKTLALREPGSTGNHTPWFHRVRS